MNSTQNKWKNIRRWLPGVLISVIIIFVLSRVVAWGDLATAFQMMEPGHLLAVFLLTFVWLGIRGLSWRTFLEGKPTFMQSFLCINIGYLGNNIFPLKAGEIARSVILGQSTGLGTMRVLSTVVIERAFDLALAAGCTLSTLPFALEMDWAQPVAMFTLLLVIAGFVSLYLMARFHEKVHAWVERLGARYKFVSRFILPQMDSLLLGLQVLRQPKRFILGAAFITLSWGIAIAQYMLMVDTIVPFAPIWWGTFLTGMLSLGVAIPSTPGSLGVYEGAAVAVMAILKIAPAQALAIAVILHFYQYLVTGVLGIIGLIREGKSLGSLSSVFKPQNNLQKQ